jgi:nucleoid-associated protein YgaU
MIGIKIADGAFFPILEENKAAKKRLVLTTAHDAQTNVQIDIYKSSSVSMNDAIYIGTLLVENITQKKKGGPSIELVISYGEDGELSATAYDIDKPEEKNKALLIVSIPSSRDNAGMEDLEFEHSAVLDEKFAANVKLPKTARPVIIASAAIIVALTAFALWFFVLRPKSPPPEAPRQNLAETPPREPVPVPPVITPVIPPPEPPARQFQDTEPPAASVPPPAIPPFSVAEPPTAASVPPPANPPQTQTPRQNPSAPVYSAKVPDVIPAGGVKYRLRWGDTLWDVSQAFYRTPWYYRYIARYNGLRNPNRIVSGRTITIPPPPR